MRVIAGVLDARKSPTWMVRNEQSLLQSTESLAALLSLGMVLQPLPPTPSSPSPTFPSSQISTTSPTHTQPPRTTSSDPGCSAAHLACAALPHLCASVSTLAQQHALSGCRVMGPWHLAAMQQPARGVQPPTSLDMCAQGFRSLIAIKVPHLF
eukprot:1161664-Pelagomonas_calceolata.AAC.21